ncbi:TetR/AcrR family transcriptional regulator [Gordonia sp. (in: high G+C Gram-positive bacteria)]|uniref:TetR/AcrR family transcriptional regulator n=1 Tax=Gordonia sp. (in: high G+C Gram-positive bacteria) TaxID=84139 RepID=UPI0025BED264|nr:TetR/AcrR family transcriptional regulator [Gordonia sp. (in: high G+C Gram-positive bacteria)]
MSNEPRQERAIRTREQILTGAVEVLVEHGYAGMTMQRVQSAAGVSRGALTHHFGSMTQIAVAAVDFIAENQSAEIRGAIAPETSMLDAVEVIHEITRRPTFVAGLQLWMAARTEPALREALQPGAHRLFAELRQTLAPFVGDVDDEQEVVVFLDGLLSLLRGLAIGAVLRDRPDREKQVLATWLAAFAPSPRT